MKRDEPRFARREPGCALKLGAILLALLVMALALSLPLAGEVPGTISTDPALPRMRVGDAELHAETIGPDDGLPVVALHGGPGGDYRSLLALRALAAQDGDVEDAEDAEDEDGAPRYRVLLYDRAGSGLSPRVDPVGLNAEAAIAELERAVDAFAGEERVRLVGESWGAMLATAFVGRHPSRVARLALAEPPFLTAEIGRELRRETEVVTSPRLRAWQLWSGYRSLALFGPDAEARRDYFAGRMLRYEGPENPTRGYYCPGRGPADAPIWRVGAAAARAIPASLLDEEGRLSPERASFAAGVERYAAPVLLLAGACSSLGPDWQARHAELFLDARLVEIPDAGHYLFHDNPEAAIEALRDYLAPREGEEEE